MSLEEVLEKHTDRQLAAFLAHLDNEYDRPSRTDHYLMALRADVVKSWARNPGAVKIEHMRLKFKDDKPKERSAEEYWTWVDNVTAMASARTFLMAGYTKKGEKITKNKEQGDGGTSSRLHARQAARRRQRA